MKEPHRATSIRLARSAGDSPAEARARSLVAWMAGRRETDDLKPIDKAIFRMAASHQAVTEVNAQVAPISESGGRTLGVGVKAVRTDAIWLMRTDAPAGW